MGWKEIRNAVIISLIFFSNSRNRLVTSAVSFHKTCFREHRVRTVKFDKKVVLHPSMLAENTITSRLWKNIVLNGSHRISRSPGVNLTSVFCVSAPSIMISIHKHHFIELIPENKLFSQ